MLYYSNRYISIIHINVFFYILEIINIQVQQPKRRNPGPQVDVKRIKLPNTVFIQKKTSAETTTNKTFRLIKFQNKPQVIEIPSKGNFIIFQVISF